MFFSIRRYDLGRVGRYKLNKKFNYKELNGSEYEDFTLVKDDIIQTALLNLTFQGQFGGMRPKMKMDKFPMTLIRPLCLIREEDIRQYAALNNFRQQLKNCPYEDASQRNSMKEIIARMEQLNPEFEYSFFRALEQKWDIPLNK